MDTVNKVDLQEFMRIIYPKGRGGHGFDIFTDLISVYSEEIEYTFDNFMKPFVVDIPEEMKKSFPKKETYNHEEMKNKVFGEYIIAGGKRVKYSDYLYPMFFISFTIKHSENLKVKTDVAGRIFNDFPIGKLNTKGWDTLYDEWFGENYKDWRYQWKTDIRSMNPHHFTLSESEHKESDMLYEKIYLKARSEI